MPERLISLFSPKAERGAGPTRSSRRYVLLLTCKDVSGMDPAGAVIHIEVIFAKKSDQRDIELPRDL